MIPTKCEINPTIQYSNLCIKIEIKTEFNIQIKATQ